MSINDKLTHLIQNWIRESNEIAEKHHNGYEWIDDIAFARYETIRKCISDLNRYRKILLLESENGCV